MRIRKQSFLVHLNRLFCNLSSIPVIGLFCVLVYGVSSPQALATPVRIASEGSPRLSVVVSPQSSEEVQTLAAELVDGLNKITGARFQLEKSHDFKQGIVIGTDVEWPGVLPLPEASLAPSLCREDYLLKTESGTLWLIGRTEIGAQNAIWDFFYRIGFRQFLPGPHWEIWPVNPDLVVEFNDFEKPDYFSRNLSAGSHLAWEEIRDEVQVWKVRNRLVSGFMLRTGHAYGDIVRRNRECFTEHPEWLYGEGGLAKLDPSRVEVLDIATEYALQQLAGNKDQDSISMDPSDGGNWRPDSPLGNPSNQAVTLANHVAQAIQESFPGAKVGMYAYNEHSLAPDIVVDPNVIISVATAFIQGGHSPESLIADWRAKGAEIGIREYLGTSIWNKALPGQARASDLSYIASSIPIFYQLGARYYRTDASDAWGPYGISYYLTSRLLWDTGETEHLTTILDDFFSRAFGEASGEMREFYERYLFASGRPLLSEDLVGRMYRTLKRALTKTKNSEVVSRIEDLVLYTRYVEFMLTYESVSLEEKKDLFPELARFAYLTRHSGMVDYPTVFRILGERGLRMSRQDIASLIDSFRDEAPLSREVVRGWMAEGIARHQIHDFEPVAFSRRLQPYQPASVALEEEDADYGLVIRQRGTGSLYLYSERAESTFRFRVSGGHLYGNRGPVKLALYADAHALVDVPIWTRDIPEDKTIHEIQIETPYTGLHRLDISDGDDRTEISWPVGQYAVFPVSMQEQAAVTNAEPFVFYLPEGARTVSGYSSSTLGRIWSEAGEVMYEFSATEGPGYFSVAVPEIAGGQIWKISGFRNREQKLLLTVPPFIARSASELLVPQETQTGKEP